MIVSSFGHEPCTKQKSLTTENNNVAHSENDGVSERGGREWGGCVERGAFLIQKHEKEKRRFKKKKKKRRRSTVVFSMTREGGREDKKKIDELNSVA